MSTGIQPASFSTTGDVTADLPEQPLRRAAPLLVSIPEAARLLSIGRSTAYELVGTGQLETVHIGRAARVPLVALDAFVRRLREAGHQELAR